MRPGPNAVDGDGGYAYNNGYNDSDTFGNGDYGVGGGVGGGGDVAALRNSTASAGRAKGLGPAVLPDPAVVHFQTPVAPVGNLDAGGASVANANANAAAAAASSGHLQHVRCHHQQ